jgi:hypothetical protein
MQPPGTSLSLLSALPHVLSNRLAHRHRDEVLCAATHESFRAKFAVRRVDFSFEIIAVLVKVVE